MKATRLLACAVTVFTTGCGCDADLRIQYNPPNRTLSVGESFTPSVRLLGCGGTEPLSDVITWTAEDTSIVRVNSASGQTLALRSGTTRVLATGQKYRGIGGVEVTVVSR